MNILKTLIDEFLKTKVEDKLLDYLAAKGNLPGPRGNLELAAAFANTLAEHSGAATGNLWLLCLKMTAISPEEAPVNTPDEFIPFCGTVGIGSIAATHSHYFEEALSGLRKLANDQRWRMREGVAMGLQRLAASNAKAVLNDFNNWISNGSLLELRAVAAAVAEPPLLKDEAVAKEALLLNQQIIQKLIESDDRKSENFRVLRKALGYTLSVVIVPLPVEGFEFLRQLTKIGDADVNWIIRENLKKNRLLKKFPGEVASLKNLLN